MRRAYLLGGRLADDRKEAGPQDDARVNIDQDHELAYWSEKFGVSRDQLRSAVAKVGPMVKNVREHLQLGD